MPVLLDDSIGGKVANGKRSCKADHFFFRWYWRSRPDDASHGVMVHGYHHRKTERYRSYLLPVYSAAPVYARL